MTGLPIPQAGTRILMLMGLKFELKVDSLGDVVSILIEEHEARKGVK